MLISSFQNTYDVLFQMLILSPFCTLHNDLFYKDRVLLALFATIEICVLIDLIH
jgi:hypothetical protein